MSFITLAIQCDEEKRELLLAELSLFPFSAFEETDSGLVAACDKQDWVEEEAISQLLERYGVAHTISETEKVNWNEEWEKHYEPVIVGEQCIVRATFHAPRPEFSYEIIITPKMSFGTGHHATTWQVLRYQLELDHTGKRILDVGCGTGALAIMAHKRGAEAIMAVDIDEWCIENSRENFELNRCMDIQLKQGGIETIGQEEKFEVILANITKNVLLEQIGTYSRHMQPGAVLVLSGFYEVDIPDLVSHAASHGLCLYHQTVKDQWAMLVLKSN